MSRGSSTILYFSRNCNNCEDFLVTLEKHPDLNKKVVKAQLGKHRFPSYIKSVPTIQIPDPNSPGKAIIYEGDAAFDWLDDKTGSSNAGGGGGLMDYDPMAMGGVFGGGAFAGIDEKDNIPNLSMANYNDPNAGRINTSDQESLRTGSVKEDEMSRRMEMMQQQRDRDLQQTMQRGPSGQGPPPPM